MESKQELRKRILEEANTWLGTRWIHSSAVKGAGCDCGKFIAKIFADCGLLDFNDFDVEYPRDFARHKDHEMMLTMALKYCKEVDKPLPCDILFYKFGRVYSHAALVIDYPLIMHAHIKEGVVIEEAGNDNGNFRNRQFKVLRHNELF